LISQINQLNLNLEMNLSKVDFASSAFVGSFTNNLM
jgi:hypothetical protein